MSGRRRRRRGSVSDAIARARAFDRWLKAGSPSPMAAYVTEVPSSADLKAARDAGVIGGRR